MVKFKKENKSVLNEHVEFGGKGFHGKGSVKALGILGALVVCAGSAYLAIKRRCKKSAQDNEAENTILKNRESSKDTITVNDGASRNRIEEMRAKCDCDIRKAAACSDIRIQERRLTREFYAAQQGKTATAASPVSKMFKSQRQWIDNFRKKHQFPNLSNFPILHEILNGTPDGCEDAMLFHLLGMFGGLCFSRVRAESRDGRMHAPNIQVIIVGESGSGKGKFKHVYDDLFHRVIQSDRQKMRVDKECIIQTVGLQVSAARFYEVLAHNNGVHMYAMEEELAEIKNIFGKNGKLDYNILCKAFDNGDVSNDNMRKGSVRGSFQVFYNYTFTGTPGAMRDFFPEKEQEGGTARRHIIAPIPELDLFSKRMIIPKGEKLEEIRNQIDAWRKKYCFFTDADGTERPCEEHTIDLSYLKDSLNEWIADQFTLSMMGGAPERNNLCLAFSTIAFHCAIVLHMLAGEPDSRERSKRKAIKEATVYIADYCMERFIYLFGKSEEKNESASMAMSNIPSENDEENQAVNTEPQKRRLTEDEILEWYPLWGTTDSDGKVIGYGSIAKKLNVTKDSVHNSFKRYEKNQGK